MLGSIVRQRAPGESATVQHVVADQRIAEGPHVSPGPRILPAELIKSFGQAGD